MTNAVKIGLDAGDVVDALRRHHPAYVPGIQGVGRWVTITEWCGIDLLALDAWSSAAVIGYEVKVGRGDMRAELLEPTKRMEAVSRCTQFYFAVPAGMLRTDELAFEEPDWSLEDFQRAPCPGVSSFDYLNDDVDRRRQRSVLARVGGPCVNPRHDHRGRARRRRFVPRDLPRGFSVRLPVPAVLCPTSYTTGPDGAPVYGDHDVARALEHQGYQRVTCPTCGGRGYSELSRVEREAPTLWVPKDVGLVEISDRGVVEVKRAPRRKTPQPIFGDLSRVSSDEDRNRMERQAINQLVRWVSGHPDPRHDR